MGPLLPQDVPYPPCRYSSEKEAAKPRFINSHGEFIYVFMDVTFLFYFP